MKNNYEVAEITKLGNAKDLILGMKFISPQAFDWLLGDGFYIFFTNDIDEGDEENA